MKYNPKTVLGGSVPSPLESKSLMPSEEKKKSNERRERLNKINFILYQHCHAVDAIDSSKELVYNVINGTTVKKMFSKEETKFSPQTS